MDTVALKAPTPLNAMMTDAMPLWFWRDTLIAARAHLSRLWGLPFDEVFTRFARDAPYSQFNILVNYAAVHERSRYQLVLHNATPSDGAPVIVLRAHTTAVPRAPRNTSPVCWLCVMRV